MKRLAVVALLMGCGGSVSDFQSLANSAKSCDTTVDRCVLAGAAKCLCATAVNANHEQSVNEAAAQVNCGGQLASCAGSYNPRCIEGRCVATTTGSP